MSSVAQFDIKGLNPDEIEALADSLRGTGVEISLPAQMVYDDLLRVTGLDDGQVLSAYPYGSHVYGTSRHGSDWDYIVVAKGCVDGAEFRDGHINVHAYLPETFARDLGDHAIHALECHFLPRSRRLIDRAIRLFVVDHGKLRQAISAKSSHSWVKAKKKLTVESGQEWIGVKSLFHSLRIAQFGIQLGRDGGISDYAVGAAHWREIRAMAQAMEQSGSWSWEPFAAKFKPVHNALMTEFRTYAAKQASVA